MSNGDTAVDHLVYCVPDLDSGIARIEDMTGIRAVAGGRHPGVGTRNALISLGPRTYLEIIAPDPGQDAYRRPRVFRLDEIEEPTLVTWAAATTRIDRFAGIAFDDGQRLGDARSLSRVRPDGVELNWKMTDPHAEIDDGIVPFLIDWGTTPHPGADAPAGAVLVELRAQHVNPESVIGKLRQLDIDLPVGPGARSALVAVLDAPSGRIELS